jgi:simple sugar transport system substrate-binding protein
MRHQKVGQMKKSRSLKIAAGLALSALALTGLQAPSANAADKTIYVLGGGDAFFAIVKNGINAATPAANKAGIKIKYLGLKNYDNIGPDMVKLIRTAVSQKPAAIALPNWVPAAQNPEIKKAVAAKIPVFLYNSGQDELVPTGAKAYIGTNEYQAGVTLGKYLASLGSKNGLCINTSPGAGNITQRCDGMAAGMKSAGGKGETLELSATSFANATAISNAVKGALTKDSSIDAVFTISSVDTDAANAGIAAAQSKALLGSWDVSPNILTRIRDGKSAAAVDQLGWLQGYMAVTYAYTWVAFGMLPGTTDFLTGPSLITKENAGVIIAAAKTGQR